MPPSSKKSSIRCFSCEICTQRFGRKDVLVAHYRVHTGEKPFACTVPGCGRRYTQSSGLAVHVRRHTGEKPFQCQECGKRFSDPSHLHRHRRTHERKHQYKCDHDGCPRWFSKQQAWVMHQRKPHKQGNTLNHTDNFSPDSYDGQPRATPQHFSMTSSPQELDFTYQGTLDECPNWWPDSTGLPAQSQDMPQHEDNHDTSIHVEQTHTQLVLREKIMPQPTYDVSGPGHPDVATTINTVSPQDQLSQQVQELSIDPLYSSSGTATPVPSPWTPDDLYADGMLGHQRSQQSAYGDFMCSGGGPSVDIYDISNPRYGSPQYMAEDFTDVSLQMKRYPLASQPFGSPEEGSTAMDEFYVDSRTIGPP